MPPQQTRKRSSQNQSETERHRRVENRLGHTQRQERPHPTAGATHRSRHETNTYQSRHTGVEPKKERILQSHLPEDIGRPGVCILPEHRRANSQPALAAGSRGHNRRGPPGNNPSLRDTYARSKAD